MGWSQKLAEPTVRRRDLLRMTAGGAVGLSTAVAGCFDTDGQQSGPKAAVEGYFQALEDGDREAANEYAHEEGDYYVTDDPPGMIENMLGADELTVDTEEIDIETAIEAMHADHEEHPELIETRIEDEKTAIKEVKESYEFNEYAYVQHDVNMDNPIYLLFGDNGDWVIWTQPTILATGIDLWGE